MANITSQNFTNYLNSGVGSRNKTYYAQGGFPSVNAFYGTYDSLLTAHKTLCAAYGDFDNVQSITGETKCSDIPRGFTVLVEDGDTVKEYQYKKLMPNGGYSASDLEPKATGSEGVTDVVVDIPGDSGAKQVTLIEAIEEFGSKIQNSEHRQYDSSKPNGLGYIVLKNDSFINGVFANVDELEYTDYKSQHSDYCHEYLYDSEGILTNTRITSLPTSHYDESREEYNGYRLGHYYCVNTEQDVYQYYICRCPFSEQVVSTNTIYEIRYDFDLCGLSINIPNGVQLRFCGGRIFNGTIVGNLTSIQAPPTKIFDNISFGGTWNVSLAFAEWFGAPAKGKEDYDASQDEPIIDSETEEIIGYTNEELFDTPYIQKCLDIFKKVHLINKYLITTVVVHDGQIVESNGTIYVTKGQNGIWLQDSNTTYRGGFIYLHSGSVGITVGTNDNNSKRRIVIENTRIKLVSGQSNTINNYGIKLQGNNKGYNTFLEIRNINMYNIAHGLSGNIRASLIDVTLEQCGENVMVDGSLNNMRVVGQACPVKFGYDHFIYLKGGNNVLIATIYDIGGSSKGVAYQHYSVWTNSTSNKIYGVSNYSIYSTKECKWNRYRDIDFSCYHVVPKYTYELENCTAAPFKWRIIGDSSDALDPKYTQLLNTGGEDSEIDDLFSKFDEYYNSSSDQYEGGIQALNEDNSICIPSMRYKAIEFKSIVDVDSEEPITTGKWVAYIPVLTTPISVNLFLPRYGSLNYVTLNPTTHTEIVDGVEKTVTDEGVLTVNIGRVKNFAEFAVYHLSSNYAFNRIELYGLDKNNEEILIQTSILAASFRSNLAILGETSTDGYFEDIKGFKVKMYFSRLVRIKKLALYALTAPRPAQSGSVSELPEFPNVSDGQQYLLLDANTGDYKNCILTNIGNTWYSPDGKEWTGKVEDISRASFKKNITAAGEYKTFYFETNDLNTPKTTSILIFVSTVSSSLYHWGVFRISAHGVGGGVVRDVLVLKLRGNISGTFKLYYKHTGTLMKMVFAINTTKTDGVVAYDLISSVSNGFVTIKNCASDYSVDGFTEYIVTGVNETGVRSFYDNLSQTIKDNLEIGTIVYVTDEKRRLMWDGEKWINVDGTILRRYGTTANRPVSTDISKGFLYFDTTVGKTIVWDGTKWSNTDGTILTRFGSTSNRPQSSDIDKGFVYFDTTLNQSIVWNGTSWTRLDGMPLEISGSTRPSSPVAGQTFFDTSLSPKKMIVWNGTDWVNLDGTTIS